MRLIMEVYLYSTHTSSNRGQRGPWLTERILIDTCFTIISQIISYFCAGRIQTAVQSQYVTFNRIKLTLTWSIAHAVRSLIWPSVCLSYIASLWQTGWLDSTVTSRKSFHIETKLWSSCHGWWRGGEGRGKGREGKGRKFKSPLENKYCETFYGLPRWPQKNSGIVN